MAVLGVGVFFLSITPVNSLDASSGLLMVAREEKNSKVVLKHERVNFTSSTNNIAIVLSELYSKETKTLTRMVAAKSTVLLRLVQVQYPGDRLFQALPSSIVVYSVSRALRVIYSLGGFGAHPIVTIYMARNALRRWTSTGAPTDAMSIAASIRAGVQVSVALVPMIMVGMSTCVSI